MSKRSKLVMLRLLLFGSILLLTASWASAQQVLSVSSHTVSTGANVTVTVELNQGNGIGGIQFDLLFDPTFLRIVDSDDDGDLSEEVQRGNLLAAGHLLVANANQPGRISVVVAGTTSFAAGAGSVIAVDLQVLAPSGSTSLTLENVIASDPLGTPVTITATSGSVSVQTSQNQPPNAVDDTTTTAEDTSVVIDVLTNDNDPDGDTLTISGVGQPSHGSVSVQNGTSILYAPANNYHGPDSFSYTASDGRGGTDTATVSVSVSSVNDPPNAVPDSSTTTKNTSVSISVLDNDSDLDGDPLSISSVTQPAHGSTAVQTGNRVLYTPATGYDGPDSFNYTVSDGNGGTDSAQVTITVNPAAPEPVLLVFPQFLDGGDSGGSTMPNSSRIIIRDNSDQEATLIIRFRKTDGTPLSVTLKGEGGEVTQIQRTVEGRGVIEVETAGAGELKTGIVEVETLEGDSARLQGTLVFSLLGTFVSIESSPARSENLVYVSFDPDRTLGEDTGIAAYNPDSATAATVRIRLLDQNGVQVASRDNLVLAPHQQVVAFVTEGAYFEDYFDSLEEPFLGTMVITVTNGPDISLLGLVQKVQALGSALTAFSGTGDTDTSRLIFPQFIDGGDSAGSLLENTSRIVIRSSNTGSSGRIRLTFRNSEGTAISVPIGGTAMTSIDREIAGLGIARVETDGTGAAKFGVVEANRVEGTATYSGTLIYSLFGNFVSVTNSPPRESQHLFISVNPDPVLGENTGLAFYNPSINQSATLRLMLRDDLGDAIASRTLVLGPREQRLGFVTEDGFFSNYLNSFDGRFLGTLDVTVTSGPDIAALGLLQKKQAFNNALVSVSASTD